MRRWRKLGQALRGRAEIAGPIAPELKRPPFEHKGETVEEFLARGGKIKKADPGVAFGALGIRPGGGPPL